MEKANEKAFFLTGSEKFTDPRLLQNKFKRTLSEAGVESLPFEILRDTFAIRCIELGFDVQSLSEILGHSNVSTTMRRYYKENASMDAKRESMNLMGKLIRK